MSHSWKLASIRTISCVCCYVASTGSPRRRRTSGRSVCALRQMGKGAAEVSPFRSRTTLMAKDAAVGNGAARRPHRACQSILGGIAGWTSRDSLHHIPARRTGFLLHRLQEPSVCVSNHEFGQACSLVASSHGCERVSGAALRPTRPGRGSRIGRQRSNCRYVLWTKANESRRSPARLGGWPDERLERLRQELGQAPGNECVFAAGASRS